MNTSITSWGRYPKAVHVSSASPEWNAQLVDELQRGDSILPYGLGRSYGDVCLNDGASLIRMHRFSHILSFDRTTGVLRAESGLSLAEMLSVVVPAGWFTPVTPGTKFVTLGGAVANDVHGKNHHKVGTFGRHVRAFELLRSDGTRHVCSPTQNSELFRATIGGMGLTGIITWVEVQLTPIVSRMIEEQSIKARSLQEVVDLTEASDADWDYTVSWVDVMASGDALGKGILLRGRFSTSPDGTLHKPHPKPLLSIPVDGPQWLLSNPTIRVFNTAWYHKQLGREHRRNVDIEPFFYPLDAIGNWNRLYGKRGMLQYQCVVPMQNGVATMRSIIRELQLGSVASFLAVVKKFGDHTSPGMMSFPQPGLTLTLDMPNSGSKLFDALDRCDEIVASVGGRIYAAKDARIRGDRFISMYQNYNDFVRFIDPRCSSSFWRRIHNS
ncbi:MAG: FAD-binding protein [Ignavibacteria bacterium]|jgi:FAD/FMN-containing dehydrogenase